MAEPKKPQRREQMPKAMRDRLNAIQKQNETGQFTPVRREEFSGGVASQQAAAAVGGSTAATTEEELTTKLQSLAADLQNRITTDKVGHKDNLAVNAYPKVIANIEEPAIQMSSEQALILSRLALENESRANSGAVPDPAKVKARMAESVKRIMADPDAAHAVDHEIQRSMLERETRKRLELDNSNEMKANPKFAVPDAKIQQLGAADEQRAAIAQRDESLKELMSKLPTETKLALKREGATQAILLLAGKPEEKKVVEDMVNEAKAAPDAAGRTAVGEKYKTKLTTPATATPAPGRAGINDFGSLVDPKEFSNVVLNDGAKPADSKVKGNMAKPDKGMGIETA